MGNDRGSIVVSGEYRKEDGVGATARGFAQYPRGPLHPTDNWTTVGAYGGFDIGRFWYVKYTQKF